MNEPCTGSAEDTCCGSTKTPCPASAAGLLSHFDHMIEHCLSYARSAKEQGKPIVGIMCEFTPRELIMAAGAVPVCLCGGSQKTAEAAETVLSPGICPLIRSTFGYHLLKNNPFQEMADLIVAETTCDAKKKMYELLAQQRPVYILELPQKPNDPDALLHWRAELVKFRTELEQRFNVRITDEKLRQAITLMNRERSLRRQLAELMRREHPPLTGRQLLNLKSSISGIGSDLQAYEQILQHLRDHKQSHTAPSPVRVLMTGVPTVHGAERVIDLIESHGGCVVAMENCTGLKPITEDVATGGDPIDAIAAKYFHLPCSVMTPNTNRFDLLRQLTRAYRPRCVIELIWQGCLTYDIESALVKQLAEEQLGLPYLRIMTDYAPADSARIAVRIEALFETVQSRPQTAHT
ncbi:MAG: 2-hydroxyacyl-CoA dehydratase [Phycisphaeraceae bacterium]|nr:2-hydroxyacyl-CoA dehydratase [Phycisphaeraceae bacterium]